MKYVKTIAAATATSVIPVALPAGAGTASAANRLHAFKEEQFGAVAIKIYNNDTVDATGCTDASSGPIPYVAPLPFSVPAAESGQSGVYRLVIPGIPLNADWNSPITCNNADTSGDPFTWSRMLHY